MKLVTYTFKHTVYHRRATCGGLDSEFSHASVETGTYSIVVPDGYPASLAMADCAIMQKANHDNAFTIEGRVISDVNAILYSPQYRI